MLQFQSGYVKLREYRHKIGLADDPYCDFGEIENLEHYLLHSQNYDVPREKVKQNLFLRFGVKHLTVEPFLEQKEEDIWTKYSKQEVLNLLDSYIDSTKDFKNNNDTN